MNLRCHVALAVVLLATLQARAQEPYEDRWAEDVAWCRNTRASGTGEMPWTISRRAVQTFASSCRVLSAVRTTHTMWRLQLSCRDEGQSELEPRTQETFVLRVDHDRLYLRDNTGVRSFSRCSR